MVDLLAQVRLLLTHSQTMRDTKAISLSLKNLSSRGWCRAKRGGLETETSF